MIDFESINIQKLNQFAQGTLSDLLGMKVTEVGSHHLVMSMPVTPQHHQPMGLLHGGAIAALAENVGSLAGHLSTPDNKAVVGLSLKTNHLKSVREGNVFATARAIHLGQRTQVWEIETRNEKEELINVSRLTLAVIDKK